MLLLETFSRGYLSSPKHPPSWNPLLKEYLCPPPSFSLWTPSLMCAPGPCPKGWLYLHSCNNKIITTTECYQKYYNSSRKNHYFFAIKCIILLLIELSYELSCPSFVRLVCHNFLKRRKVKLPTPLSEYLLRM